MKKNLTKIVFTAGLVVSVVFVIVLMVAVFGGIGEQDFDNMLVKGLFVALAIIYFLLAAISLILLYTNDELVKEISLNSSKDGGTNITVSDVRKKTKQAIKEFGGVKCTKCVVVENEYGVRLKLTIKVNNKNIADIDNELRKMLENTFVNAYNGFRFHSIEMRVKKLKIKFNADEPHIEKVDAPKVEKEVAVTVENEEEQSLPVQQTEEEE